ncbi:secondary thiamine-phosphate synthase enzyme YjbQ [Halorussus halophilus]|uniref:secondary thiamine-phosphate synthase enzyme YjbQ n=1 Tax=Halorussus halophilus TaxID=2650975 RepID=UPI00130158A6|nr:secondary thiamine-phosphate synthase enzyme YjbQ [Halorussus halophilus]
MFQVETQERTQVVDVTEKVRDELQGQNVSDGLCTVFVQHTTAGVVVNEAESGLLEDIESFLQNIVPDHDDYRHDRIDDNADSHLRALLLGESATVPIEDGELALGTWQKLLFVECDGPRTRRVRVTVTD